MTSFGTWVRQQRRSRDLTQAELAKLVGCATITLRTIETKDARPSKQLATRLAQVLGVAESDIAAVVAFARGSDPTALEPQFPPPAAAKEPSQKRRVQLPTQLTGLVGRTREIDDVYTLLLHPDVHLVTLTGPGGIGKTRMAVASALQVVDAFPDGVVFVDLAAIIDPDLVLTTIAQCLGMTDNGRQPLPVQLATTLQDQTVLLLLDNFEQVLAASSTVTALLRACPHLKVLTTSRTALGIVGEYEQPVPPLALPDRTHLPPFEHLSQYEAVRLFSERARAANPQFVITTSNASAVAEICYQLDGLPLAIELVSAWMKVFEPQALLARLDPRLSFLTGGRDRPTRQQTMRNTIAWSYQLLSPREQVVFQRFSVFVGGATLSAITAVCTDPNHADDGAIVDDVAALVNPSLLHTLPASGDAEAEPRFGMLQTIRAFAVEQLDISGDGELIRQRHALYFTTLAEDMEGKLSGPQQGACVRHLEREHDNLRAVMAWSLNDGDLLFGMRVGAALVLFWELHSHFAEGRRWIDALLTSITPPSVTRLRLLYGAAMLALDQNKYEQAEAHAEAYAVTAQSMHDPQWLAEAFAMRGKLARQQGKYEAAATWLAQALALFRTQHVPLRVANMLMHLGMVKGIDQRNPAEASPLFDESFALYQQVGYPIGMVMSLLMHGNAISITTDFKRLRAMGRAALELAWANGFSIMVGHGLALLSVPALMDGRPVQAAQFLSAAEDIFAALEVTLLPDEQARHDHWRAAICAALSEHEFTQAWATGRALPREQLIALALA